MAKNTAKMTKIRLDKENKKFIYEIEFYTERKKYKYNIDVNRKSTELQPKRQ